MNTAVIRALSGATFALALLQPSLASAHASFTDHAVTVQYGVDLGLGSGFQSLQSFVVTVGDTTCGKPVGFLPADGQCGTTYNVVNFESVNALNQGRYFNGFAATCAVAEDFTVAQGAGSDPLVATAAYYADTGACAPMTMTRSAAREGIPAALRRAWTPDERSDMVGR